MPVNLNEGSSSLLILPNIDSPSILGRKTAGVGAIQQLTIEDVIEMLNLTSGPQGYQGYQGEQGFQGGRGFQGYQGEPGAQGATGAGTQGVQGYQGNPGAQGEPGEPGAQGYQGVQGTSGNTILSGSGIPSNGLGSNGDFYINIEDPDVPTIYGPKAGGSWSGTGPVTLGGGGGGGALGPSSVTATHIAPGAIESIIGTRVVNDGVLDGNWYGSAGRWKVTSATANFNDRDVGKPIYSSGVDGKAGANVAYWKTGAYIYAVLSSTEVEVRTQPLLQLSPPAAKTDLKVTIGGLQTSLDIYTTNADDAWGIRQYANVTFEAGEQRTFGDIGHSIILDIDIDGHGQNIFPLTGFGPSGVYNIFGTVNYKTKAGYYGGGVSFLSNLWHSNDASLTDPDPYTVMFGVIMQPYINAYGEHLTYHGQIDVERTMLEGYVDQPVLHGQPRSGYWGTLDFRGFDVTSFEGDEFIGDGAVIGERNGSWQREVPRLDLRGISSDVAGANEITAGSELTVGLTGQTFIFDTSVAAWPNRGEFYCFVMDNLTDRNFIGAARVSYNGHDNSLAGSNRWKLLNCEVLDGPSGFLDDADPRARLTVATTYTDFLSFTTSGSVGISTMNGEVGDVITVTTNPSLMPATGWLSFVGGSGETIISYQERTTTAPFQFKYCAKVEGPNQTIINNATVRQVEAAFASGMSNRSLRIEDTTAWGSGVPAGVDDFNFTVMADDGPAVCTYRSTTVASGQGYLQSCNMYSKDRTWIRDHAQISTAGILQRRYAHRVDPLFRAQFGYPYLYGYSDAAYTWLMDKHGTDFKRLDSGSTGVDRSIASYGNSDGVVQNFYAAGGSPYSPSQLLAGSDAANFMFYGRTGASTWVDLANIRVFPAQSVGVNGHGGKIAFGLVQNDTTTMSDVLTLSYPPGSGATAGVLAEFAGRVQTGQRLTVDAGGIYVTGASSINGALAMNASKITGLADPTVDQDAATKAYVDSKGSGVFAAAQHTQATLGIANSGYSNFSGWSWVIPSGTLASDGDFFKAQFYFTHSASQRNTEKIRILFGRTGSEQVAFSMDPFITAGGSGTIIFLEMTFIRTGTGSVKIMTNPTLVNITSSHPIVHSSISAFIDNMSTTDNTLKVQGSNPASANDITAVWANIVASQT